MTDELMNRQTERPRYGNVLR